MQFHVSTDDAAERDRFPLWAGAVQSTLGLDAEPAPGALSPFRGTLSGRSSGPLLHLSVAADAHRIAHRPLRGGTQRSLDGYRIYREASVGAWFRIAGVEGVTRTGDLVVYDTTLPLETRPQDDYLLEMWLVPRALLEPHLPALGRPLATVLSGHGGMEALAASYLDALTRNWDSLSEESMGLAADTLARLIGIACGAVAAAQPGAVRAGRLAEAMRHIERHLADPSLSPASVAAALGIATRTLHALFEQTGSSFARTVQRRRLEECRAALQGCPQRAVTDIAFAWGFTSLSLFYRAFQAAFGMASSELRATSRTTQCC
jgi:AraC-like DNA-binding protein